MPQQNICTDFFRIFLACRQSRETSGIQHTKPNTRPHTPILSCSFRFLVLSLFKSSVHVEWIPSNFSRLIHIWREKEEESTVLPTALPPTHLLLWKRRKRRAFLFFFCKEGTPYQKLLPLLLLALQLLSSLCFLFNQN